MTVGPERDGRHWVAARPSTRTGETRCPPGSGAGPDRGRTPSAGTTSTALLRHRSTRSRKETSEILARRARGARDVANARLDARDPTPVARRSGALAVVSSTGPSGRSEGNSDAFSAIRARKVWQRCNGRVRAADDLTDACRNGQTARLQHEAHRTGHTDRDRWAPIASSGPRPEGRRCRTRPMADATSSSCVDAGPEQAP